MITDLAQGLRNKFGHWETHPDFPLADWQYEVANDDTRLGYWEWVAVRFKEEEKPG